MKKKIHPEAEQYAIEVDKHRPKEQAVPDENNPYTINLQKDVRSESQASIAQTTMTTTDDDHNDDAEVGKHSSETLFGKWTLFTRSRQTDYQAITNELIATHTLNS